MENNSVEKSNQTNDKNIKLYSILAYIGILWIVGLLVKEKDNKTLRFHVGQGMLISIIGLIVGVVKSIVTNVFVTTDYVLGVPYTTVNGFGVLINAALSIVPLVLMIIGIVNAANNKEQELPVVGQFAFYK